jgi:ABC-type uncharacterized transport system substrate-binding protein
VQPRSDRCAVICQIDRHRMLEIPQGEFRVSQPGRDQPMHGAAEGTAVAAARLVVPNATSVALLINPNNPESTRQPAELQQAARPIGLQLVVLTATSAGDIDGAFTAMVQHRVGGLIVGSDPFYLNRREQIIALAAQHAIPTIYGGREVARAGGLTSYGNNLADAYRRAGLQTGRILKGAKPSELPVDQATKFEFVINLKTAKTLGIEISATLLARADEVIE